jgi:hypothetical protein
MTATEPTEIELHLCYASPRAQGRPRGRQGARSEDAEAEGAAAAPSVAPSGGR